MPSNQAIPGINRLLAALAFKDRKQLFTNCEPIELIFAEVLCRALQHVYFPTACVISLMTPIIGTADLEVKLIGNEGMLVGVDVAPFHAKVRFSTRRYRRQWSYVRYRTD